MSKYVLRSVAAASLVVAALAFALPARAQEKTEAKAKKPALLKSSGMIESIDAKAGTVVVKQKDQVKTFKVNDATKYSTTDKKEAELGDLKVGEKVNVSYAEENGAMIAHRIAQTKPVEKIKPVEKKDQ